LLDFLFFIARMELIILTKILTEKTQNKEKIHIDPSEPQRHLRQAARSAGESQRHSSTRSLDWEEPPCGEEVDGPQH
jgi:hypothetical protein